MQITCYITNLPTDHTKVLAGNYANKMPTGDTFTINDNLVWGADNLKLQLATQTRYDYCKATLNGVNYFYFMLPAVITPVAISFDLILDYWATYGADNIKTNGVLVQGHELLQDAAGDELATLPVQPIAGREDFRANRVVNPFSYVCIVAQYTIKYSGDDGHTTEILVYSAAFNRSETALNAYISNFGTAYAFTYDEQNIPILSVNGLYLVPAELMSPDATPRAAAVKGYSGTSNCNWPTGIYSHVYHFDNKNLVHKYTKDNVLYADPEFIRVGNLGAYVDIPFTGKRAYYMPSVYCNVNANAGNFSLEMRYNGQKVDMLQSLSLPYPAAKTDTPQTQRLISDAVLGVSGIISVAGSAASGNALGVISGVASLGKTAADIYNRVNYTVNSVTGSGLINTLALQYTENNTVVRSFINGIGLMYYDIKNLADVKRGVELGGFSGMHRGEYQLNAIPVTVGGHATFRRFADPENVYKRVNVSTIDYLPLPLKIEIEEMLRRGYWIYDTLVNLNYGISPEPWTNVTYE